MEKSVYGGSPVELYRFNYASQNKYFTSADVDQVVNGATYVHDVITRGEIDASDEDQQGRLEITVPSTNAVAALFLPAMPADPVTLTLYRVHRGDSEVVQLWTGEIASVAFAGSTAKLSGQPVGNILRRQLPTTAYQAQCNWALYSTQCGVLRASHLVHARIVSIVPEGVIVDVGTDIDEAAFSNGYVVAPSGERRWVTYYSRLTSTTGQLWLLTALQTAKMGDVLLAYPGCDRTISDCKARYSNLGRFMGFPFLPTVNPFVTGLG